MNDKKNKNETEISIPLSSDKTASHITSYARIYLISIPLSSDKTDLQTAFKKTLYSISIPLSSDKTMKSLNTKIAYITFLSHLVQIKHQGNWGKIHLYR